jgi:hypothetical protein
VTYFYIYYSPAVFDQLLHIWQTAQVSYLNLEEPPLILVMEDCVFYVEWTPLMLPISLPGSLQIIVE